MVSCFFDFMQIEARTTILRNIYLYELREEVGTQVRSLLGKIRCDSAFWLVADDGISSLQGGTTLRAFS